MNAREHISAKKSVSTAYAPPLQRTAGQPPPIAANGGLSYMAFDNDGDAGTVAATPQRSNRLPKGTARR